ncbi:hypothetical protein QTP86_028317, partial [Hemibagrus guttatus]
RPDPNNMDSSSSPPDPLRDLVETLRQALTALPAPAPTSPAATSANTVTTSSAPLYVSPMAQPVHYSGLVEDCNGFILQCSLVLEMQPHLYPTERSKVVFVISQLCGRALLWAESLWSQNSPVTQSYAGFVDHFREVFGKPSWDSSVGEELCRLQQGKLTVPEYTLQFWTLAAKSGWNKQALLTAYRQGLNPQVRLHLAAYEDAIGLERLIQLSIRVAARMQSCVDEPQDQSSHNTWRDRPAPVSSPEPAPEPMHLGTSHLTPAERQRRLTQNLCLYCGAPGHAIPACPIRPPRPMVSTIFTFVPKMKPLTTHGTLTTTHASVPVVALLDSGSVGNFISCTLCRQLGLRTKATATPYQIQSISGKPISRRQVSLSAGPVLLQATSIESPFVNRPLEIPTCYAPFSDVFCPKRASKLPPHQPWDCAIDLLPGEPVPRGRIYPLSIPEEKAMEEYIKEALAQGYIHLSTSPAASSFFFVAKKDGGLWPCIDYRALNRITVKFSAYNLIWIREGDEWKTAFITPTGHYEYLVMPYGLANAPSMFQDFIHEVLREFLHRFVLVYIDDILIYSRNMAEHRQHVAKVLERLRKFQLFLKVEKCSFHQPSVQFLGYKIDSSGIQMDEGKITAIRNWPAPTTMKELQRFLGFANFYRRFIQNYSSIANPLTSLLRNKPKSLAWSRSGPVSTAGEPEPPPSFFSRKLNPVERNYDIGNRELLAVKLALEEWRHWMEGARHPFTVLTDHKNLEYLRAAKRLNPRQARWALFFTWFNFTISYRPGSKNTKADALSRMFEETLPPANASTNTLPGCPPESQYIPRARRIALIHSAHTSLGTGHPGIHETLSLLKDRFWWPNMTADVRRYVQGCEGCAMSKDPRHLPSGKLLPLPVPSRPWSHIGVDFITDLPTSRNHTCVFVVIDRFSKSCHLLPLKGPPTALETAQLIFNHVFRYFSIPEDIVSDRGPQFVSRIWRAFLTCLGVAISLSSGYHPQTNGQMERKIQEISPYLRTFCHSHQNSWSQYLGWAEYAQNSLRQPSTGLTPFQCVLGYQPPLFPWSGEPSDIPAVDHWFRESERVWDSAHHQLQRALHRRRRTADLRQSYTPAFQPGQKVWLSTRDIRLRLPCRKLNPRFIGPLTILKQINSVTYKLQLPPGYRIHPTFHVSLLKPHHPSVSPSTEPGDGAAEPPLPLLLDDGTAYEVKEILHYRHRGGQLKNLVDWEGYGPEERPWVARDDILDPNLLEALHAAHPHRPAPRGRGRPPRCRGPWPSGAGRREGGNVTDTPGSNENLSQSQAPRAGLQLSFLFGGGAFFTACCVAVHNLSGVLCE